MTRGKYFRLDYNRTFEDSSDVEYNVTITRPMAIAIISQLQYLRWLTRWDNAPSEDAINAFVDEIEYRLQIPVDGGGDMGCDNVADCVKQNITNIFQGDENVSNITNQILEQITNENTTIFNEIVVAPSVDNVPCADRMYGAIRRVLDKLNQDCIDLFEFIEVGTNNTELIDWILGLVPLPHPAVLVFRITGQVLERLFEGLQESYLASVTEDFLEQTACEIFCRLENRCEITLRDIYDGIEFELPATLSPPTNNGTVFNWFDWLAELNIDDALSDWPYIMWLFMLDMAKNANWIVRERPALNIAAAPVIRRYKRALEVGFADGDGGWKGLCECREQFTGVVAVMATYPSVRSAQADGFDFNPRARLWTVPTWNNDEGYVFWSMRFDNVNPSIMGCYIYGIGSSTSAITPTVPIYLRELEVSHRNSLGVINANVGMRITYIDDDDTMFTINGNGTVKLARGVYKGIFITRNPPNATENNNSHWWVQFRAGVNIQPNGFRYTWTGNANILTWNR